MVPSARYRPPGSAATSNNTSPRSTSTTLYALTEAPTKPVSHTIRVLCSTPNIQPSLNVILTAVKSKLRGHSDRKKQGTMGRVVRTRHKRTRPPKANRTYERDRPIAGNQTDSPEGCSTVRITKVTSTAMNSESAAIRVQPAVIELGGQVPCLWVCEEAGHPPISERSDSPFATMLRRQGRKGNPA